MMMMVMIMLVVMVMVISKAIFTMSYVDKIR